MSGKPLRTATYSRVSTAHHDQNPDVQRFELRRYCEARGWSITEEIVDHGYSGGTDKRPGLKRLMELARSRKIDAVAVVKMDRLFRSLRHLVATLEELQALGITFVATADAVDYSTPQGRLFVQIMGSLNEFEKALARERTLLGLAHARSQGKKLGRPVQHDPDAIIRLRREGLTYREIARRLKAPAGTVSRVLRDARKSSSNVAQKKHGKTGSRND